MRVEQALKEERKEALKEGHKPYFVKAGELVCSLQLAFSTRLATPRLIVLVLMARLVVGR